MWKKLDSLELKPFVYYVLHIVPNALICMTFKTLTIPQSGYDYHDVKQC